MKLYNYWRSSASWRVRIGLNLKGLAYEYVPVHLLEGQQRSEAHVARNPMGQIPVLELDDGTLLRQSLAIVQWLDTTFPTPPLIPLEPVARARCWELAEIVNSGIQPLQNLVVLARVEALGGDRKAWAAQAIAEGLGAMEAVAAEVRRDHDGPFLLGASPTIADICLVPQIFNARRFGASVASFPLLVAAEEACNAMPAFARARPEVQPDADPG